MFSNRALKKRQRQKRIERYHTRKFRHQTHISLVHFHYRAPSHIQFILTSSYSIRHYLPASRILLYTHGRIYCLNTNNTTLLTCWRILLIFYNFMSFFGCGHFSLFLCLFCFCSYTNTFSSDFPQVQLLPSQCSLCTSPLNKPNHTFGLRLLIYAIRHIHYRALYDGSVVSWTAECVLCRRT